MDRLFARKPLLNLFIIIVTFVIAYYACILLDEWGHSTAAWLLGQKHNPFEVYYGGWALLHADENVDYTKLFAAHRDLSAAIIGIGGITTSALLFILSLIFLARSNVQKNLTVFTLLYWSLTMNMMPLLQYLSLTTFSDGGDIGYFTRGLHLSPWWIFIPGTMIVTALWHIFSVEIPRAYAVIPINRLWGRRLLLLATLIIIFLLIYTHNYNPLIDPRTNYPSKILAALSIALPPLLFFLCDPSRNWVKDRIAQCKKIARFYFLIYDYL